MKKILLLADYSRESERRLLKGLVNYANQNGGCSFHRMSSFPLETTGHSRQIIDAAHKLGVDAIFGTWMDPTEEAIRELGIPVILRTIDKDYPGLPMLSGQYREIGEVAAEFFLKRHYANLAFIGLTDSLWSDQRWDGFNGVCLENGVSAFHLTISDPARQRGTIEKWLAALPKPVALFACNDAMATMLSEICQFCGITVPDDVALLGADNDTFLCNISYPRLSSINLDFEKQGYQLGETIFRMIDQGRMWPERINIEPSGVEERESTMKHMTSDKYLLAALRYMDEHFTEDINIEDIIKDIPLSRRALEIRFRKELAPETISSYLKGLRIRHMCALLQKQEYSVSDAAEASGLTDSSNVCRIFRKFTGMSPLQYRTRLKNFGCLVQEGHGPPESHREL